jgi:hypothetical protein
MFTLAILGMAWSVATAGAQPPVVTFPLPAGTSGMQIPLATPTNENPVDYGVLSTNFGWNYDSFQANATSGALFRAGPTQLGPGAYTAMGESADYVFHLERQFGCQSGDRAWSL